MCVRVCTWCMTVRQGECPRLGAYILEGRQHYSKYYRILFMKSSFMKTWNDKNLSALKEKKALGEYCWIREVRNYTAEEMRTELRPTRAVGVRAWRGMGRGGEKWKNIPLSKDPVVGMRKMRCEKQAVDRLCILAFTRNAMGSHWHFNQEKGKGHKW